ncbi:MAG TPA: hypothetical protein V6D06_03495 [Trichocoleus sp.]
MTYQRGIFCRSWGLLGMGLGLVLASLPVQAAAPSGISLPPVSAAPAAGSTEAAVGPLATVTYQDLFSIQVPEAWETAAAEELPLVITNFSTTAADRPAQAEDVRTEINWIEKPPAEVVPQALQDIQRQDYEVADYGTLTIDGATALRVWLVNLPDGPTNSVTTYIGYQTGTAVITSRFDTLTPEVERQLTALHSSFSRL